MRRCVTVCVVCLVFLFASAAALAGGRPDKGHKDWFAHFAGGYSIAGNDFGNIVDDDIYLNGGVTYWPEHWAAGVNLDLAWSDYDLSNSAIGAINAAILDDDPFNPGEVTGGDVSVWALSVNGIWGPDTSGSVGFYVIGGVGLDFIDGKVTNEQLVYYPPICDPWYWWCVPGGIGQGTVIVADDDTTEFAWSAGIGVDFEVGSGGKLYVEAKFHSAETDRASTEVTPIVVGYRW